MRISSGKRLRLIRIDKLVTLSFKRIAVALLALASQTEPRLQKSRSSQRGKTLVAAAAYQGLFEKFRLESSAEQNP